MAFTPYRAESQPPYRWRLPNPHPQSKLQPLDLAAMEGLFEDLRDVRDLVADTEAAQRRRYPSR